MVLFPPAEAVAVAEEFRRLHDPMFHRIAAHVAVVPAFSWRAAGEVEERVAGALAERRSGPFPATLSGVGRTRDGVVFVRVEEGAVALARLRDRLVAALEPPPDHEERVFVPVLGIGRATGRAEAEFLQRQVAGHLAPARFSVESLSLVVEDEGGLWKPKARFEI